MFRQFYGFFQFLVSDTKWAVFLRLPAVMISTYWDWDIGTVNLLLFACSVYQTQPKIYRFCCISTLICVCMKCTPIISLITETIEHFQILYHLFHMIITLSLKFLIFLRIIPKFHRNPNKGNFAQIFSIYSS